MMAILINISVTIIAQQEELSNFMGYMHFETKK